MLIDDISLSVERKTGVTLYVQIKEAILDAIAKTPKNKRIALPPQRDLANKLGVSRNTVSMAYSDLERDGIIASFVGKGTFVVRTVQEIETHNRVAMLHKTIEHSVEEALSMGFTLDEYREITDTFLEEKKEMLGHIKLAFVECNREQLQYFAEHLTIDPGVMVVPVLLRKIRDKDKQAMSELQSADCIVTSFFHMEEIENLLPEGGASVVGINLQAEMPTIVKIARIPASATIGLVAASRQFLEEMCRTLDKMGISRKRIQMFYKRDEESDLSAFISSVDNLIVSPSRKTEVEKICDGKPVVEFLFAPDGASINSIRVALLELREHKNYSNQVIGESDVSSDNGIDVP